MNKSILRKSNKEWGHPLIWLLGVILLGIFIYLGWGGIRLSDDRPLHLVVYAFSTQEEVLLHGIFPVFEQAWEAETGKDLILEGVFGPSGTLSVQITQGAPADVAIFSNQRHIDWLKFSRVVNKDTEQIMIASTP